VTRDKRVFYELTNKMANLANRIGNFYPVTILTCHHIWSP